MSQDEEKSIINEMVLECVEQLDEIEEYVLHLEEEIDTEFVNKIFRIFHSIKGNIGMIGFAKYGAFAHKLVSMH